MGFLDFMNIFACKGADVSILMEITCILVISFVYNVIGAEPGPMMNFASLIFLLVALLLDDSF